MPEMDERTTAERLEAAIAEPAQSRLVLRLYVAGASPSSAQAVARLRAICDGYLADRYDLEIVDVHQQPERAGLDDILAIPTLLRELPAPLTRIVGDLSDEGRVLIALGVEPRRR